MPIPESKREAVAKALIAAFGTSEFDAITPMSGGMSGALVYRIRVGGIAYLLRLEGTRDAFRDPDRWYRCMTIAAGAYLAPRVRYADPTDGVAIMEFIVERSLGEDYAGSRAQMLTEAAQTIRALHEAPAFPPLVDYVDGVAGIVGQLQASGLLTSEAMAQVLGRYGALRQAYRTAPEDLVSSHNDLNPRNILYDGRRLWLVDWESSFLADRYVDLATLANFLTRSAEEEEVLLHNYFGRTPDARQRAKMQVMRQLNHLFYGAIFLAGAAAERPGVGEGRLGLDGRSTVELHQGLAAGDFDLDAWEGRVTYGRSRLAAAVAGMATPAFDQAVRLLAA